MNSTVVTSQPGVGALLERHRPLLKFDAQEPYLAIGAESIVLNPGNLLLGHDGTVLAQADGADGLSLDLLARYPPPLQPHADDRLDEAPDVLEAARRLQAQPELAERAYGRAVKDDDWLWLQYWFWLYYNPKHLVGFGKHEGDWELIQIGLDAAEQPRVVTYAQHNGGAARGWEEIERHETDGDSHPVVYVAPFSHASYFEPRTHFHPGGLDSPDGKGPAYLPQIEQFGDWALWPGRWGNSSGVLPRLTGGKLGGRSPASPGAQKGRWERPTAFHNSARRKKPFGTVDKALWSVGHATFPAPPSLKATLQGPVLVVEFSVDRSLLRSPGQVYVTAHDATDPQQPVLRSSAVKVRRRRGQVEMLLPREPESCLVRGTSFNWLRQRSDPAEVIAERA